MALADPQNVTIGGTATSLPRVITGASDATYSSAVGDVSLRVSHTNGRNGSRRSLIRLEKTKVAADPLTSVNTQVTMSAHIVVDAPRSGFTDAEKKGLVEALAGYLTASSSANTIKILGGES